MDPIAGKVVGRQASLAAGDVAEQIASFSNKAAMDEAVREQEALVRLIADATMEAMLKSWQDRTGQRLDDPSEQMQLVRRLASAWTEAVFEDDRERLRLLFAAALGIQLLRDAEAEAEERSQLWETTCTLRPGQLKVLMHLGAAELASHGVVVAPLTDDVMGKLQQAGAFERLQGAGCIRVQPRVTTNNSNRTIRSSNEAATVTPVADLLPNGTRVLALFADYWPTSPDNRPPPQAAYPAADTRGTARARTRARRS